MLSMSNNIRMEESKNSSGGTITKNEKINEVK